MTQEISHYRIQPPPRYNMFLTSSSTAKRTGRIQFVADVSTLPHIAALLKYLTVVVVVVTPCASDQWFVERVVA